MGVLAGFGWGVSVGGALMGRSGHDVSTGWGERGFRETGCKGWGCRASILIRKGASAPPVSGRGVTLRAPGRGPDPGAGERLPQPPRGALRPVAAHETGPGAGVGPGGIPPETTPLTPSNPMDLKEAQARVDAWISQFEEGYWPPLVNLARLMEEVGELARELNHRHGAKTKKPEEPEADLALEMADVLFVLLALANEQGVDLSEALERTLEKYRVRDSERWVRKDAVK
jgi:NTP pyrophosphatase (non-canonical NTP hydrolase)